MSQEPKKRHSRQRQGKRRASIRLAKPAAVVCTNCANYTTPHTVCSKCGYYKGQEIMAKNTAVATNENA